MHSITLFKQIIFISLIIAFFLNFSSAHYGHGPRCSHRYPHSHRSDYGHHTSSCCPSTVTKTCTVTETSTQMITETTTEVSTVSETSTTTMTESCSSVEPTSVTSESPCKTRFSHSRQHCKSSCKH
jgi:hypothetical protein